MKTSMQRLRAYLAEAIDETLNESEIYVDENGYAHDDEGNVSYVGKGHGGRQLYKASSFGDKYGSRRGSYASQPKPPAGSGGSQQVAVLKTLSARMPNNNFIASVKTQVERGGSLSPKQKAVVVQILQKFGMTAEAGLFA